MKENQNKLIPDIKWRITLPNDFCKNVLKDERQVVITRLSDTSFAIYPKSYFEEKLVPAVLSKKFDTLEETRRYRRYFCAHSFELDVGSHNRINVPKMFRPYINDTTTYEVDDTRIHATVKELTRNIEDEASTDDE